MATPKRVQTLSLDDVLAVHDALIRDFEQSGDPFFPSGVKDRGLLESAVSRQHVGFGGQWKYPDPISNAATLLYGICCDHPFHNGNKRTALVAGLAHLDRNRLSLFNTSQSELYELMIQVADHKLGRRRGTRRHQKDVERLSSDEEVRLLTEWLRPRTFKVARGERQVTYREVRKILSSFGFVLENPSSNMIDVVRYEQQGLIGRLLRRERQRIGRIGWPGDNRDISKAEMKHIREVCRLREEDGVDSDAFYSYTVVLDSFVNRYRKVLRALKDT